MNPALTHNNSLSRTTLHATQFCIICARGLYKKTRVHRIYSSQIDEGALPSKAISWMRVKSGN